MATVNKNFRIKHGLIVEGATGTINGQNILTETGGDTYILNLVGGATLVKSVSSDFNVDGAGNLTIVANTFDSYGSASAAQTAAEGYTDTAIDGLDTDDIEEGSTNLYHTAQRAKDAAADLLTNATKTNITITGTGAGLTITAENGVADSDTDDLTEGSTNLYFTNQRALDATNAAYDAAGSAGDVASDLTDHENATEAHGATGAVVGTTNTQTLSNKTISYTDNTLTVQVANVSDLTASAAELNILDGITASTAELNLLDGVTATTAELNYVDGVTSGIQGQLDDKAPLASPSLTGTPLAPTAAPGTNNTQIATTAYADAAVAALVDGAPDLLNTLNELAAAIDDDANFASTLTTLAGEKVAKSGDTMTGLLVLSADPSANLGAATKQYVDTAETDAVTSANSYTDGRETAITTAYESYADTAEADAKTYADGLASNYDAAGSASAAQTAAEGYADGLTDDMLDGTTPFTVINVNDEAKQIAASTYSLGSVAVTAYEWAKADYRSGKFLVKIDNATHNEISEILLTLDSTDNIAITEYAIVGTNGSRGTITADVSGSNVRIRVNPVNDSTIKITGTLLK